MAGDVRSENSPDALYRQAIADHGAALNRLARSYEADAGKRGDLLQDIHLALWRSFATFDGRCSLRTWLYRIAHNVATTHVIRSHRLTEKFTSLEDLENTPGPDHPSSTEDKHTLEKLMTLIHQLNVIDHAVIVLYLEGEDAASIADVTGLSPANVATKIHRVKKLLAHRLQEGQHHDR